MKSRVESSVLTGQDELLETIMVHADSILEDIISEYLEERKAEAPIIQGALKQNDYPALREIGHDIEGTGGAFGFEGLAELGRALRLAAGEEDNKELEKIAEQIETYLRRVKVAYY